jgi:hypothetical protein
MRRAKDRSDAKRQVKRDIFGRIIKRSAGTRQTNNN